MSLIKRLQQITLSQKQWSGITGSLITALVVAILVLLVWSLVSLTSTGDTAIEGIERAASLSESGKGNAQPATPEAVQRPTNATTPQATPIPVPTGLPTAPTPPAAASSSSDAEAALPPAALNLETASLEELILATEDPEWSVRWDAVNELGGREDVKAVPALVQRALYDVNTHPQWRSLWALSAVDRDGVETVPLFIEALEDADPVVVHNAALGLAFFDRPEARPALIESLKSPETFRRWEAVFSLRNVGNDQVVDALIPLLDAQVEPDDGVRGEVALALGRIALEETTQVLLDALRNDTSPKVRWRTTLGLASATDPSVLSELKQALLLEQDSQVRDGIEKAIAQLDGT